MNSYQVFEIEKKFPEAHAAINRDLKDIFHDSYIVDFWVDDGVLSVCLDSVHLGKNNSKVLSIWDPATQTWGPCYPFNQHRPLQE